MLHSLPTDEHDILRIAHNSDYGCRFILGYLGNVKPIVKGGRFLQIKTTYYNPASITNIPIIIKDNYKSTPMALRGFGNYF